ncbi:hypothetical protein ABK040_010278 [Willaertia magna]
MKYDSPTQSTTPTLISPNKDNTNHTRTNSSSTPILTRTRSLKKKGSFFHYLHGELHSSLLKKDHSTPTSGGTPTSPTNEDSIQIDSTLTTPQSSIISPLENNLITKKSEIITNNYPLPTTTQNRMDNAKDVILQPEQLLKDIYNFLTVPFYLESFLFFGFLICFDTLLFYFTFFPLRILMICFSLIFKRKEELTNSGISDLLKCFCVLLNVYLIGKIPFIADYSRLYHMVRGESSLKLYMIYGMLEVFDKLCSAFGQDSIMAMCYSATDPKFKTETGSEKRKLILNSIISVIIHCIYMFVHTVVYLLKIVTLNVALNSRSQNLITMLISTNFVELKSMVFRKSGREALFQLSCSDIVERFEMTVFSLIIFFHNSKSSGDFSLEEFIQIFGFIIVSEVIVDALKHSFICKFNNIKGNMYNTYTLKLCSDLTNMKYFDSFLDNTNIVSRRLGFVEGPLMSLLFRFFIQSLNEGSSNYDNEEIDNTSPKMVYFVIYSLVFVCLFLMKVLLSILIVGHAAKRVSESSETVPFLPNRYEMFEKRIP